MNDHFNTTDIVDSPDKNINSPEIKSDPFTGKVWADTDVIHEPPMDETVIHETPMDETVIHEPPMDETVIHETTMDETVVHETAIDETVVHETPMDETVIHETPMDETVIHETLMDETVTHETPIDMNAGSSASLLNREESEHFRTRWNEIQGKFVDEPRSAVEQADALVTEVIELITQMFANEHRSLEGQWNHGNDISTEDLRMTLKRYRSFFNNLVV